MPYIQKGDVIDFLNGGGVPIAYGSVVNLTNRIGVAAENIAVGATGSVYTTGVFELPAINNAPFAVGATLYWDPVATNLTNVAVGTIPAGWATEPKLAAGAVARVRLCDNSFVVNPLVLFAPQFIPGERFTVTYPQVAAADAAKTFWIAPAACKVVSAQERHVTVSTNPCTLQIEKLNTGEAPGAGDEILAKGFNLKSAANTPVEDLAVADGKEDLVKGDALALKVGAGAIAGYDLGTITVVLEWA